MFTSIGESKIPLGLLIFSSVLNIFMDLWMVAGLGLGVFGVSAFVHCCHDKILLNYKMWCIKNKDLTLCCEVS